MSVNNVTKPTVAQVSSWVMLGNLDKIVQIFAFQSWNSF